MTAGPGRYTLPEIQAAFPPIPAKPGSGKGNKRNPDDDPDDLGHEDTAHPENPVHLEDRIAQAEAYVSKIPGALQGNRHSGMLQVASILVRGFDLPDGPALVIILSFASRCEPPVDHSEAPHFLEQARRYGKETVGGRVRQPLPNIEVTTDEKGVADKAVAALVKAGETYQRGNRLVQIVSEGRPNSALKRPVGAPHIAPIHVHHLRELISAAAKFFKRIPKKNPTDPHTPSSDTQLVHVPVWCANAIHARASWRDIHYLQGVVTTPVLREDGSILDLPGYDPFSGIYFSPQTTFPPIPVNPTEAEAKESLADLREVFCDFPFATVAHEAVNIAAVLTPFARPGMNGSAPLTLYDANAPGAGKGLIADTVGVISTGRTIARMPQAPNDEEEEKRLAGIAQDGDAIVLIDNITRPLGSGALDAILTSTSWKPRILGKTGNPEFEVKTTFLATGNNVQIVGDLTRRTLHCRLRSDTDHPEDRTGFRHPELLKWVTKHHPRLAVAALTILRAYIVAGRPSRGISPWGSFEDWSRLVREPIVWLMGVDPMDTREELETHADLEKVALKALRDGWKNLFGFGQPHTVRELMMLLNSDFRRESGLREALCTLCPPKPGNQLPDTRQVGNKFKSFRERPIDGICFIPGKPTAEGQPWILTEINNNKH